VAIRANYGIPRSFAVEYEISPAEAIKKISAGPGRQPMPENASLPEDYYVASAQAPADKTVRPAQSGDAASNARLQYQALSTVAVKPPVPTFQAQHTTSAAKTPPKVIHSSYRLLWFDDPSRESSNTVDVDA
jgi:hypothetical protein